MTAVLRSDARLIPLRDASVDLIVTSPPYFAQRSYRDGGEHYEGQIGSEAHPQAFLDALWAVMHECWRVLKPEGVCFVNLGDKRAGSGGHNNAGIAKPDSHGMKFCPDCGKEANRKRCNACGVAMKWPSVGSSRPTANGTVSDSSDQNQPHATRRNAPDRYIQTHFGRRKSKQLLPHRFAIGCEDGLADPEGKGWIVSDYVWSKLNGLPESVQDRCRDSHEYIFQLTKSEKWFAAIDEVRVPHRLPPYEPSPTQADHPNRGTNAGMNGKTLGMLGQSPLGALPPSVWPMPSEPLRVPDWARERLDLPDHFAAFPTELARRCILGWSPSGICTACGEGRRPVSEKRGTGRVENPAEWSEASAYFPAEGRKPITKGTFQRGVETTITGQSCACPEPTAPTKPSVVLDVFGGTGTTAMVARSLGRTGVSIDLSMDYARLARWRIFESGGGSKAVARTNAELQGALL